VLVPVYSAMATCHAAACQACQAAHWQCQGHATSAPCCIGQQLHCRRAGPALAATAAEVTSAHTPALQAEAIKAWKAAPSHLLLADQAGSGKTLAYLLPLVQAMRQAELKNGRATTSCSPQVVVLTPTTELAQQVRRWWCSSTGGKPP
jgi:superfamily II DNA or RNA helicase